MAIKNLWARFLLVLLVILVAGASAASASAARGYTEEQHSANSKFDEGSHGSALRKYKWLAKKGDKYSQYRMSYMKLHGFGSSKDVEEAFGWSEVAAESGEQALLAYRDALWASLPEGSRADARKTADKFIDRYGYEAIAEKEYRESRKALSSCTGSRLGKRCEDLSYYDSLDESGGGFTSVATQSKTSPASNESIASEDSGEDDEGSDLIAVESSDLDYYIGLRETMEELQG